MSTAVQVAGRIGNAVRKIEGLYVPRNGRGLVQMPLDHPFKVWVKSTGDGTADYAVCEIHPDVVTDPVSLAGRVWVPDETCYEIATLTWTEVTESGWIYLDFTDPDTPAFEFISTADEITTPLTADQIPIAEIIVEGSFAKVRQLQFGDIMYRAQGGGIVPVKLTSQSDDETYVGDRYDNGTDVAATVEDVLIKVRDVAADETLSFTPFYDASEQKWTILDEPMLVLTLVGVPLLK